MVASEDKDEAEEEEDNASDACVVTPERPNPSADRPGSESTNCDTVSELTAAAAAAAPAVTEAFVEDIIMAIGVGDDESADETVAVEVADADVAAAGAVLREPPRLGKAV